MTITDTRSTVPRSSLERRTAPVAVGLRGATLTKDDGPTGRQVFGYAAVFNSESRLIPRMTGGAFVETIAVGFFDNARNSGWPGNQGSGVLCRFNHSDQHLLGSTRATPPTLTLNVDDRGLQYSAQVPSCRGDVVELIRRGEITNSSFTFASAVDSWRFSNGVTYRTLHSGELWDVGPVSGVAGYTDTSCALRSLAAYKGASEAEIRRLAEQNQLAKLFTRTDIDRGAPAKAATGVWDWRTAHAHYERVLHLHAIRMAWH